MLERNPKTVVLVLHVRCTGKIGEPSGDNMTGCRLIGRGCWLLAGAGV